MALTQRMPVFPLGTVLFPETPIHLHIFEPRYQRMARRILEEKAGFVVSLIKTGQEALGSLASPHSVGTIARIHSKEDLAEGRMNIVAFGEERVRISAVEEHKDGYLEADAEILPFRDALSAETMDGAGLLRQNAEEYFQILRAIKNTDSFDLPRPGTGLIFLCSAALPVPVSERQGFLESGSLAFLARDLAERYAHYIHLMQAGQADMAGSSHLN